MFNYRHPGPRRVWKVGSEQHLLTPLWAPPLPPAPRALNSKTLQNIIKINDFGTFDPPKMRPTLEKPKENQCSGLRTFKNLRKINVFQSQAPGVPQEAPGSLQRPQRSEKEVPGSLLQVQHARIISLCWGTTTKHPISRSRTTKLFRLLGVPRTKYRISLSVCKGP